MMVGSIKKNNICELERAHVVTSVVPIRVLMMSVIDSP